MKEPINNKELAIFKFENEFFYLFRIHYSLPNDPIPKDKILKMDIEQKALFDLIYR